MAQELTGNALMEALKKINPTGKYEDQLANMIKQQYEDAVKNHPIISPLITVGNTAEDVSNAALTGDLSKILDYTGMPFSVADQQAALQKAQEDTKAYYEAEADKAAKDKEALLKQKQIDYQTYLANQGVNFQQDKETLDQNAAERGVLFSGSRAQKEQALQNKYLFDQSTKQQGVGADIASSALDYQYQYGNEPANKLSNYYNLGANTYNANTARGGVGSGGISNIYSPGQSNYYGTQNTARMAEVNKRAAGLLANRGNKLLSTGYKNQF